MKCPKCQFENREKANFCLKCGRKLEFPCPQCGNLLPAEASFCDTCGYRLEEEKEAPAIDLSKPRSYTPKHLADQILTSRSALEGERKLVTVLFADVASYTSLSEKLDPEEVHQIMDGCFQILMDEIHRYEGTINQFTGDGVMALFGAPLAHEDHTQRACHAAISIQKAMADYGEKLRKQYGIDFRMRIGLNSGPVVVGKIGDDLRMDYTAIGDTTNLASRMQSLALPGTVLVSSHTHKLARDFFEFSPLGKVSVKGKEEALEAYQLLKPTEVETRIEAAAARGLTRFVGRKNSMAALMEAWEKVLSGLGQIVGIVGEAGVGKSRLLLEFRSRIPQGTFTYLEGRCLQYGGSLLYLPILDILRSYFGMREGDREHLIKRKLTEKLSSLEEMLLHSLPCFQDLFSLKVEDEAYLKLDPKQRRERIFEGIRDLLVRESQNQPLILAIEDLHWIDHPSQDLLDYLIGWLANTPVLLLLLYRPEYTHPWGNKSYYNRIGLDQLSLSSSAELVAALLEGGEVAPELKKLILTRAAGNPLFMEEFTSTLLENGTIRKQDHTFTLTRSPSEIQVPDTIQGIISARMDRLQENLKRTLQVASVIGRDFAFRILQMITGMQEELKSHLLNLQGLEFIYEKALFPELEYIFKHGLTQEVAYNSLLLKRRKEIHERIGRAIEEIYPERIEEFYEVLAYHYSRAENSEKAYSYLKLAGDKANNSYSPGEAFRFYRDALGLLQKGPEDEQGLKRQLQILRAISGPMRILAYPEDSLQMLSRGEQLSEKMGDQNGLTLFHSRLGHYFTIREGNPLRGIEYSERSFEEAEKIQDIDLMAITGWDLCVAYTMSGQYAKNRDFVPKVIDVLEKAGKEYESFGATANIYSVLHGHYALSLGWTGDFDETKRWLEKGLQFAAAIDDRTSLGLLKWLYGYLHVFQGDGAHAKESFLSSLRYIEEVKYVTISGSAWSGVGWGSYLLGDLDAARRYAEKGLETQKREGGVPFFFSWHFQVLGMVHFELGEWERAQSRLEEALEFAQKSQEMYHEGYAKIWLGRTLGRAGVSGTKAEECILDGIGILDRLQLKPWLAEGYLFLGELYVREGRRAKALDNLKKAYAMFREMGMDYWLSREAMFLGGL